MFILIGLHCWSCQPYTTYWEHHFSSISGRQGSIIARSAKGFARSEWCCQFVSPAPHTCCDYRPNVLSVMSAVMSARSALPLPLCLIVPLHTHTHTLSSDALMSESKGRDWFNFVFFGRSSKKFQILSFQALSDLRVYVLILTLQNNFKWVHVYMPRMHEVHFCCICVCMCVCVPVCLCGWVSGMRQHTVTLSWQSRNSINNWWKMFCGHFSDSLLVERKMGRDERQRGEKGWGRDGNKRGESSE